MRNVPADAKSGSYAMTERVVGARKVIQTSTPGATRQNVEGWLAKLAPPTAARKA
jgi:hypothetical protein